MPETDKPIVKYEYNYLSKIHLDWIINIPELLIPVVDLIKGLLLKDRQVIEYTSKYLPEGFVGVFFFGERS